MLGGRFSKTAGRTVTRLSHRRFGMMADVLSAAKTIVKGDDYVNPKKLLERKYLYFALIALHHRKLRLADPDEEDISLLYEKATEELAKNDPDGTSNVELRRELQRMLTPQIESIFETFATVDQELGVPRDEDRDNVVSDRFRSILNDEYELCQKSDGNAFFETKCEAIETLFQFHGWSSNGREENIDAQGRDAFGVRVSTVNETTLSLIRHHQTLNLCRSALIRKQLGYSVLSLRSTIPGAGRGLFLDGFALGGSILAFQPGDIWPKEHLVTEAPEVTAHFEGDNDMQISLRFDEAIVDARQSPATVLSKEGTMNPMALAHMANHPSPSMEPNVQSTMLDFMATKPIKRHKRYIPNTYAKDPSWLHKIFRLDDVFMHGLCLLSKFDVANTEVVYDYRLQSEKVPEWYHTIQNKDDDGLDNERIVFFRDDWQEKEDGEKK